MNILSDWAHFPEKISPIIFTLGPIEIRWYSVLFLLSFLTAYFYVVYRVRYEKLGYSRQYISYIFILGVLFAVIGGRLGYIIFYNFKYFWSHPLKIFFPFETEGGFTYTGLAGLSYHGSLICIILAAVIIAKKDKVDFWRLGDIIMTAVPLGYTFGRLGNFLTGELYGRITTSPIGMYFPRDTTSQLRHPSQLYEAFFEGIFLFFILWCFRNKKPFDGFIFSLYFIGYGLARFFTEYFREPDPQLGFVLGPLSMGQVLCLAMILTGIIMVCLRAIQAKKQLLTK